ncbi:unnamed protein product, partial [Polarella glacialis]
VVDRPQAGKASSAAKMSKVGLDAFLDDLVKVHLKQLDPQATKDIENTSSYGWTEIVFICIILALGCSVLADFLYPYFETYVLRKRKKRVLPPKAMPKPKR